MIRPSRALAMGALALGCVGAFLAGDRLQGHAAAAPGPAPRPTASTASMAAMAATAAPVSDPLGAGPTRSGDLGLVRTAAFASSGSGRPSQAYVETPDQRADRHRVLGRQLDTLGTISAEKRAALFEFNDEATQVQMGLQSALLAGTLDQANYDAQLHQRIVVQLEQLRSIVTEDEYRKLTGLEPGVDPYEYMRTGIGAAPGADSDSSDVAEP